MSYPPIENERELLVAPQDRIRVSAYYDENGRVTNLDVIVNQEINISDLGAVIDWVARTASVTSTTAMVWPLGLHPDTTTSNGATPR